MKERPILFSGPMVRAILSGQKTQTRRTVKPVRHPDFGNVYAPGTLALEPQHVIDRACPYGQPGDRLWVREAFRFAASLDRLSPNAVADKCLDSGYRTPWAPTQYEADGRRTGNWRGFDTPPVVTEPGKLRPGIHMPRWASRISLEITGVRVERLNNISYENAIAEGMFDCAQLPSFPEAMERNETPEQYARRKGRPQREFASLWEEINGAGAWAANPWVWVIEFRRV